MNTYKTAALHFAKGDKFYNQKVTSPVFEVFLQTGAPITGTKCSQKKRILFSKSIPTLRREANIAMSDCFPLTPREAITQIIYYPNHKLSRKM